MAANLILVLADSCERLVPARLELRRHQPVLRISGVVLPECPVGGVRELDGFDFEAQPSLDLG